MLPRTLIKEVLVSNERWIEQSAERLVPRQIADVPSNLSKVLVLYGIRRSGKTSLLYQRFLAEKWRSLYVDFEDDRLAGFELSDFSRLTECAVELRPGLANKPLLLLLDEVQRVQGWERFCRRAVEREGHTVIVSGSSSKIMPAEIATELRGRSIAVQVFPFSFEEFLRARGVASVGARARHGPGKALLRHHFADYLRWGGFPEVARLEHDVDRARLLHEYLAAMYFRDLAERYAVANIPLLDALSDKLFSSFSTRLSLAQVAKQYKGQFPFSKDGLYGLYKNFRSSLLVYEARMFAESSYKRQRNPPKIYLADTGLCRRVTSADTGRLLENVVFLELKRRGAEVFHFQATRECDFVTRDDAGGLAVFQVTVELSEHTREREIAGLAEAAGAIGAKRGVVITAADDGELYRDGVTIAIAPVWRWLLEPAHGPT
jgi:uncharacterized protein